MDNESDSMVSGGHSQPPHTPIKSLLGPEQRGDSVLPNESASHHGEEVHSEVAESRQATNEDSPFPFKFKAPSGRVHRLNIAPSAGIAELVSNVSSKIGSEMDSIGGEAVVENGRLCNGGYALSYVDNEGDTVSITTDQDLTDAVTQAIRSRRDKVELFVHDPEKPPIAAPEPQPAVTKAFTPPESVPRSPTAVSADDDQEQARTMKKFPQTLVQPSTEEQLINGVPNDLILPGAIVTLAAVIMGVFVMSRAGSR